MLIKKGDAVEHQNSQHCTVWEYTFPTELFSYAVARINGRYPEEKRVTNLDCEEIYHVISGSGIVHSEKGDFSMEVGDAYFFERGEAYWVEGENLMLALVNAPQWTPEQHQIVD